MMLLISSGSPSRDSNRGLLILQLVICGFQLTWDLQAASIYRSWTSLVWQGNTEIT